MTDEGDASSTEKSSKEQSDENEENFQTCQFKEKNFIRRNIELAAAAVTKLPITDEEKKHLAEILATIDNEEIPADTEPLGDECTNDNNIDNPYKLNVEQKSRISDIDWLLENNFTETRDLKKNASASDSFWQNLILEQRLKSVDEKLEIIKKEEEKCLAENNIIHGEF